MSKIKKARAGLVLDLPFFGSLVLRMKMIEDNSIETTSTNGREIKYNPEFVDNLPLDDVKGLLAHEVMHVALCHHTRRGNRDTRKWNIAADYAINILLQDAGFKLPVGGLINQQYRGWSTEKIFSYMPDENGENSPENYGQVEDATGEDGEPLDKAGMSEAEQQAKIMASQAVIEAKMQGNLPGGIEEAVGEVLKPAVNWREILRRFVTETAKNDYTWTPPNRRHIWRGVYLPSSRSEEIGSIVVAVDTSGSIGHDEINQFFGELSDILETIETDCVIIQCDTEITSVERYSRQDLPIRFKRKGCGGTDFHPPFRYIEDNDISPSCLIYLTDMQGDFPDEPSYPVLWGVIDSRYSYSLPGYGEEVIIS